jgi:NADH-quinone oxidoreductase subunit K
VIPAESVIDLAVLLFTIGALGALLRRNLVVILMSLQLMFGAGALAFVGFDLRWARRAAYLGETASLDGQAFAFVIVGVAVVELALGLAILLTLVHNRDSLDVDDASLLRW